MGLVTTRPVVALWSRASLLWSPFWGNPVQLVHLIVDTGSSALAVSHPNCTTATKSPCTSHAFDPAYSQTFAASRISHRVVTMEYDRGRWQGSIGTDLVEIINFEDSRHKKHRHQRRDAAILVPHTNHKSLPLAPHHMGMNRSSRPLDSGLPWGQAHLIKPNSTLQFGRAVGRTPNLLAKLPWRLETGINLIEQAWSIFTFGGFDGIVGLSPRAAWLQSNRAQVLLLLSGHHSRLWLAHSSSDQPVIEARLRWAKLASATNSTVVKLLGPRNALHFRARCTQILVDSERLLVPVMPKVMKGSMLNGIDPPTTQLAMEAVFDTGTTYLLLPAVVHQALMKRLQDVVPVNKAIWEDYCVQTHPALWPPLALVLDSGAYLTLYGRHYLREHSPGLFCMGIGLSQAPNEVVIGLRAMDGRLWGFNPQQHRMMFSSVLQLDPPSTPSEVCQWLSGQLTSFAAQVKCEPVCRADLAASASYCDNLHLEIAVDHRRYRYEGVQLSWNCQPLAALDMAIIVNGAWSSLHHVIILLSGLSIQLIDDKDFFSGTTHKSE
ncbi:uncharacterized protein MONBRDRAFT_27939 [Monosiga brevicollis MX1]|uniref:Peptidase A1 domain-containing protein n=1 Tax=Monosiga brevicollis TaxID=81824 RepID=A9V6G8_MONBE|nr:uncharacterized protein MONBRDRAFT_27939 [Monosiga brevicollis MX1]EDQ86805.1 predicted protein [Monosiga brevicollis MX1]|eukprot:XP_001748350.1 hypothetical protein [Monosiga brevicollis MX1]